MLFQFLALFCSLNAGLAIFNLLPIPPLDGSHLLALILPSRVYFKYVQYERYISFALVLLLVFNVLDIPLLFLRSYLLMGLEWIIDLIPFL
jgi:Zn-dependent protease